MALHRRRLAPRQGPRASLPQAGLAGLAKPNLARRAIAAVQRQPLRQPGCFQNTQQPKALRPQAREPRPRARESQALGLPTALQPSVHERSVHQLVVLWQPVPQRPPQRAPSQIRPPQEPPARPFSVRAKSAQAHPHRLPDARCQPMHVLARPSAQRPQRRCAGARLANWRPPPPSSEPKSRAL